MNNIGSLIINLLILCLSFVCVRSSNTSGSQQAGPDGCRNRCFGGPSGSSHSCQTWDYWGGKQVCSYTILKSTYLVVHCFVFFNFF